MSGHARELTGSACVVTGAAGGIGRATVRALTAHGARVLAVDRDAPALELLAGPDVTALVADVRDPAYADAAVAACLAAYGRLDVVVANAGIGHAGDVADMAAERVEDLLAVNVHAPLQLARAALPVLLEQRSGALVFVTSIAGVLLVRREAVYSASKAAVEAFADPLREELRGSGVTVSTVLPAVVATAFFDGRGEPYDRRFPRPQSPDRVADGIVLAARTGRERVVVPGWFRLPIGLRTRLPGVYRSLARRFG